MMERRSSKRSVLLAAGACVALAACGTRLPESVQAQLQVTGVAEPASGPVGSEAPGGPGDPATGSPTGPSTDPSASAGAVGSNRPGGASTPGSTPSAGSTSPAGPAGPGGSPATGRPEHTGPATGSPVEVGYMYISDLDGFAETFGGTNPLGNQQAMFDVVADWMNANGGLGGHEVVLVPYGAEIAGSKTYSQSEQEACTHWTQDHDVVAVVVAEIGTSGNLVKCLNDAGVLFVTLQGTATSTGDWARYPYHTTPFEMAADVLGPSLARFSVERGVVTRGDAIGVLAYDHPSNHEAVEAFRAEAESLGLVVVAYEVHTPQSTPDIAQSAGQLPSAVLAMKTADAKAVVSLCTGCMNLYMQQAESQDYYPRYVVSSYDNPFALSFERDPKFLEGAIAMGWSANADTNLYANPEIWTNATYELCREIEAPNGINDIANLKISQSICGSLLLVHQAAKAWGGTDITGATLLEGKNRIGTSWPSTSTFSPLLNATHPGAATTYRSMSYDPQAGVFVYDADTLHPFQ